jgi:hypothetical protein
MAVTIDDRCQPSRMVVAIANKHRRSRHRLHGQRQQNKDGSEGFEAFRHDKKYSTLEKSSIRDVRHPCRVPPDSLVALGGAGTMVREQPPADDLTTSASMVHMLMRWRSFR